jgi:hypothetical protein
MKLTIVHNMVLGLAEKMGPAKVLVSPDLRQEFLKINNRLLFGEHLFISLLKWKILKTDRRPLLSHKLSSLL